MDTYGPGLLNKLGNTCGKLDSEKFDAKGWHSNGDLSEIEDAELRETLDQHVTDLPGQINNSKHAARENHPEFTGQAKLRATPDIDYIGSRKFKDHLKQTRHDRRNFFTQIARGPNWLGQVAGDFGNER